MTLPQSGPSEFLVKLENKTQWITRIITCTAKYVMIITPFITCTCMLVNLVLILTYTRTRRLIILEMIGWRAVSLSLLSWLPYNLYKYKYNILIIHCMS